LVTALIAPCITPHNNKTAREDHDQSRIPNYAATGNTCLGRALPAYTRPADRGYFKSEQILACHDAGVTAYVPKPMTNGAKADGRFNNDAFIYDAEKKEYICPAGEALNWRFSSVEKA
jgi:hypothetical protein